eukprot:651156-Rhodomonas_salina.1
MECKDVPKAKLKWANTKLRLDCSVLARAKFGSTFLLRLHCRVLFVPLCDTVTRVPIAKMQSRILRLSGLYSHPELLFATPGSGGNQATHEVPGVGNPTRCWVPGYPVTGTCRYPITGTCRYPGTGMLVGPEFRVLLVYGNIMQ